MGCQRRRLSLNLIDDPVGERMERLGYDRCAAFLFDSLGHLGRGILAEGHQEDLLRLPNPAFEEIRRLRGDHAGLAGSGARQHERGILVGYDRHTLLRREWIRLDPVEEVAHLLEFATDERVNRTLAEPGWFVSGNRILMSQTLTDAVLTQRLEPENWRFADWIGRRARGDINRLAPMLPLPLGPLRKLRPAEWRHARSCNLAVWRADFDRVDGFDADYNGWGREDSDLLVRLLHAGIRRKDGNFATGVLHLWHPAADRSALPANDEKLDRVQGERRVRALIGLSALHHDALCPALRMSTARS